MYDAALPRTPRPIRSTPFRSRPRTSAAAAAALTSDASPSSATATATTPARVVAGALCGALVCVTCVELAILYELRGTHRVALTASLGTLIFLALIVYVLRAPAPARLSPPLQQLSGISVVDHPAVAAPSRTKPPLTNSNTNSTIIGAGAL